jgi:hypothetical protein
VAGARAGRGRAHGGGLRQLERPAKDDPGVFAVKVVDQIVHNRYSTA